MKTLVTGLTFALVLAFSARTMADDQVSKEKLVGTWENTAENFPDGFRQVKHITPTHFTWVLYNRNDQASLSMAGGTCMSSRRSSNPYRVTDEAQKRFRGKEFFFDAKLVDGKWHSKSRPDSEILVDEVWRRVE